MSRQLISYTYSMHLCDDYWTMSEILQQMIVWESYTDLILSDAWNINIS